MALDSTSSQPTALHHHEVLHTLSMVHSNIDDFILQNALFQDSRYAQVRAKVEQAQQLLFEAYQEVGGAEF